MSVRFFRCNRCGQIITIVKDTNLPVTCCMAEMEELVACSVDADREKHVPCTVVVNGRVEVRIGVMPHPSVKEHFIEWIAIETTEGVTIKHLKAGDEPVAYFMLDEGEELVHAYAYCNQHGLWMK